MDLHARTPDKPLPRTTNHGSCQPITNQERVAPTTCHGATSPDSAPNGPVTTRETVQCCQACMRACFVRPDLSTSLSGDAGSPDLLTPIWLNARELVTPWAESATRRMGWPRREIGFVSSGGQHLGRKLDGREGPRAPARGWFGCVYYASALDGQISRLRLGVCLVSSYPAGVPKVCINTFRVRR